MKLTRAQAVIILLALAQEVLFNAFYLLPDNWISTTVSNGIETQVTDLTIPDRWMYHMMGNELGIFLLVLGYLFVERNRQTKSLLWAWSAYIFIQCIEEVFTGNLFENELLADGVMLVALFGTALMLARWTPKLYTYYTKWTK